MNLTIEQMAESALGVFPTSRDLLAENIPLETVKKVLPHEWDFALRIAKAIDETSREKEATNGRDS